MWARREIYQGLRLTQPGHSGGLAGRPQSSEHLSDEQAPLTAGKERGQPPGAVQQHRQAGSWPTRACDEAREVSTSPFPHL